VVRHTLSVLHALPLAQSAAVVHPHVPPDKQAAPEELPAQSAAVLQPVVVLGPPPLFPGEPDPQPKRATAAIKE
jgi:hypothetical protein